MNREELAKTSCPYCGAPAKKDLPLWEALAVVFYTCGRQGRLEKDEPYSAGERYDGLFICLGNQAKAAHEELARKDTEIARLTAAHKEAQDLWIEAKKHSDLAYAEIANLKHSAETLIIQKSVKEEEIKVQDAEIARLRSALDLLRGIFYRAHLSGVVQISQGDLFNTAKICADALEGGK